MKNLKEFYIIAAAFLAGIIAKILFLNKGNRKEVKKSINNIINKIKFGKDKLDKLDKETNEYIEEIKKEDNEEKRLNKIADLFRNKL